MNANPKLVPTKEKFRFYSTVTPELLMEGIEVELDLSFTPNELKNHLLQKIQKYITPNNLDLIIYVSGGIPFLKGTLKDIYLKEVGPKPLRHIYGVLTRSLNPIDISNNYYELCNINDKIRSILLSPLFASIPKGLANIACLLGYLNHGGNHSDIFLRSSAYFIHFPPLITSLSRVIDNNDVNGRDIITICSTLSTFFRSLIPNNIKNDQLFEFALKCCNLLCDDPNIPENIPIQTIEITPNMSDDLKFLTKLNLGRYACLWTGDYGQEFHTGKMKEIGKADIARAYEKNAFFTPILPLSMLEATGCAIVRGEKHNYLYLKQSSDKGSVNGNQVDIINPMTGFVESVDVYSFAKKQENCGMGTYERVVDPNRIEQIILVCLDESKFMEMPFLESGEGFKSPQLKYVAIQFLTAFANRLLSYRIPCMIGLVSACENKSLRIPFTPFTPDFEEEIMKIPKSKEDIPWDESIAFSIKEINKFSTNQSGNPIYPYAAKRIIYIGRDKIKKCNYIAIAKELMENHIVLDNIMFSLSNKEIIVISHLTGGATFFPHNVLEGLDIVENSAFLEIKKRVVSSSPLIPYDKNTTAKRMRINKIDSYFFECAASHAELDTKLENIRYRPKWDKLQKMSTPRRMISVNNGNHDLNRRFRRILRELRYVSNVINENSPDYDDEIKIILYRACMGEWIVFIRGSIGTIYEGKWFKLSFSFPDLYPDVPPTIRFVTIPYHLNVNPEGRICLNILEKGYMPTVRVIDIIQEIKELFVAPSVETPVQIEFFDTFMHDPDNYYKKAKESAESIGKNDYNDFVQESKYIIEDCEEPLPTFNLPPAHMISQISGVEIRDPVLASSGVYYDRNELRRLVSSNHNPVCVVTGRRLTERIDEI